MDDIIEFINQAFPTDSLNLKSKYRQTFDYVLKETQNKVICRTIEASMMGNLIFTNSFMKVMVFRLGEMSSLSNIFSNLVAGEYTVYVQDKKGCGIITRNFLILDYPKFFTPNNDGYNDIWFIKNLERRNLEESIITIFDRYGKLLKQFKESEGWNGTFNNELLPASDYWFSMELSNGKTVKGHFSLIR